MSLLTVKLFRYLIFITLIVAVSSCGGNSSSEDSSGSVSVSIDVDDSLTTNATIKSLPPLQEGGADRPVAVIRDEDGSEMQFVENELLISTSDNVALNEFVKRWDATILKTIEMKNNGVDGIGDIYLLRINNSLADVSKLQDDLRTLQPETGAEISVSSESGRALLAASSSESRKGLAVGINWVGKGFSIADGLTSDEAADDMTATGDTFDGNAFNWNFMDAGSVQDIGVTEAWKLLDQQGLLNKGIKLAVLDMGFDPDTNGDINPDYLAISNVPGVRPLYEKNISNCGIPCPWHGTAVVNFAMGLLNNNKGAAGPAGPVAKPIMIYTMYDFVSSISALVEAKAAGAKIINMSYGIGVPAILSWSVIPFNIATKAIRDSGVLLFAAAGNDNANVDKKRCATPRICWEKKWYTPCENSGVICVGGLDYNSKNRADYKKGSGSNYGKKNVDIFAPYILLSGADLSSEHPAGSSHIGYGTSGSSPFAAGIAALIWTANPALSADQVADIMMRTAHTSPDDTVNRYVNAQAAVREALGTSIHITSPADAAVFIRGRNITFTASESSVEHNNPLINWSSDVDGDLGNGETITRNNLSVGDHIITATVTYDDGFSRIDSIAISIQNLVPEVTIDQPVTNTHFTVSENIVLQGTSFDGDAAPDFTLLDSQVLWTLDGIAVGSGHLPEPFTAASIGLSVGGPYILKFEGTDGVETVQDTLPVYIDADPVDLPPSVQIDTPVHNTSVIADKQDASGNWYKSFALTWTVSDPEDGTIPFEQLVWTDSVNGGPAQPLTIEVTTFTVGLVTTKNYTIKLFADGVNAGVHTITLKVTDSAGNVRTSTVKVTVDVLI